MSMQEEDTIAPVEPIEAAKPVKARRKRAKPKKKPVAEPVQKPKRRKVKAKPKRKAAKRKAKVKAKTKAKAKKPAARRRSKVKGKTKAGRPRKNAKANIHNKLYRLMKAKLPKTFKDSDGEINFKKLIKGLRATPEGVYKWFRGDHMSAKSAVVIVKLTKNRIKLVDLIPFVF